MKQLLLDADILVRAANKLNAENGPITVAQKAVKAAAAMAKKKNKQVAAKQPKKAGKKPGKKNKKAPAKKSKKAEARPAPAPPAGEQDADDAFLSDLTGGRK